jgi:hypothetical protein
VEQYRKELTPKGFLNNLSQKYSNLSQDIFVEAAVVRPSISIEVSKKLEK